MALKGADSGGRAAGGSGALLASPRSPAESRGISVRVHILKCIFKYLQCALCLWVGHFSAPTLNSLIRPVDTSFSVVPGLQDNCQDNKRRI